jgi:hypothetical protein
MSSNHFLGRQYGDFMSLAYSPNRFALQRLGVVAAFAVLGRDALADMPGDK